MPSLGPLFTVVRSEQDPKSGRLPFWVCSLVVDAPPVRRFCTLDLCGCSVAPWRRAAFLWFISLCGPHNVGLSPPGSMWSVAPLLGIIEWPVDGVPSGASLGSSFRSPFTWSFLFHGRGRG